MSRDRLITPLTIILCVVCAGLSIAGAYYALQQSRVKPTEEPPVIATAAKRIEADKLPTQAESPVEAIVEPETEAEAEAEVEVPLTCAVEPDLEAEPVLVAEPTPDTVEAPLARYELTDAERSVVESVVMAESGGESYEGQMAVAQCILHGSEELGIRPDATVIEFQYTPNRPTPSESVKEAVAAVFDRGEVAVEDTILWFYAPAGVAGTPWHESQRYVCTIGGHRFFAKW